MPVVDLPGARGAGFLRLAAIWLGLVLAAAPAWPQSTLFTVTGVEVDVTAPSAAEAKVQAINEAQVMAFHQLARRLAGDSGEAMAQGLSQIQISRLMRSLSIESERTGPGRYIASLTIRFLSDQVRNQFARFGIVVADEQAPATVILPVWRGPEGNVLWHDSPWRQAWTRLNAGNAIVPLIVPIGDLADTQTISADEALAGDRVKLEAVRIRYKAEAILVAVAEPLGGDALRATMTGDSPVGEIAFDKTYEATGGDVAEAAATAAGRFHSVMTEKWQKANEPQPVYVPSAASQNLNIAVPFNSLAEWNALRARLASTPGVASVDVSSVSAGGAIVRLAYSGNIETLQTSLGAAGMSLVLLGGTWVLQPY